MPEMQEKGLIHDVLSGAAYPHSASQRWRALGTHIIMSKARVLQVVVTTRTKESAGSPRFKATRLRESLRWCEVVPCATLAPSNIRWVGWGRTPHVNADQGVREREGKVKVKVKVLQWRMDGRMTRNATGVYQIAGAKVEECSETENRKAPRTLELLRMIAIVPQLSKRAKMVKQVGEGQNNDYQALQRRGGITYGCRLGAPSLTPSQSYHPLWVRPVRGCRTLVEFGVDGLRALLFSARCFAASGMALGLVFCMEGSKRASQSKVLGVGTQCRRAFGFTSKFGFAFPKRGYGWVVLRGSTLAREGKGEEGVVERWRLWTEKGRRRAEGFHATLASCLVAGGTQPGGRVLEAGRLWKVTKLEMRGNANKGGNGEWRVEREGDYTRDRDGSHIVGAWLSGSSSRIGRGWSTEGGGEERRGVEHRDREGRRRGLETPSMNVALPPSRFPGPFRSSRFHVLCVRRPRGLAIVGLGDRDAVPTCVRVCVEFRFRVFGARVRVGRRKARLYRGQGFRRVLRSSSLAREGKGEEGVAVVVDQEKKVEGGDGRPVSRAPTVVVIVSWVRRASESLVSLPEQQGRDKTRNAGGRGASAE
ncbi:hypothetical protein FA13DRAFT_1722800 [Coprinellus micaceus]|uniref:Uncharacterized protein n=1 Tax=Coprinellus micaceus TaxID=71717 RepID=A0A4Y7RJ03_COPMI|nr:hypothetical protein FA13DRAFT_1722800 [Coprinellus micaceus]